MPSGKTHDTINLMSLPVFIILFTWMGYSSMVYSFIFAFGYLFGTFLCGPDLDTVSNLYKRWGLFRFIWIPYRKVFPHRSLLTHGLIIGDVIRIFYLMGWTFLLFVVPSFVMDWIIVSRLPDDASLVQTVLVMVGIIIVFLLAINLVSRGLLYSKLKKNIEKHPLGVIVSFLILGLFVFNLLPGFSLLENIREVHDKDQYLLLLFPFGMTISSAVHTISDLLVSSFKRHPKESAFLTLLLVSGTIMYLNF